MDRRNIFKAVVFCLSACLLFGCKMGPNFLAPRPPVVNHYGVAPTHFHSQKVVSVAAVPDDWWHAFHSSDLNQMMSLALSRNRSISAANARIYAACEYQRMAVGGFFPTVDADASGQREKGPPELYGFLKPPLKVPTYNLYSVSPLLSFTPDIFGLTQRLVEARGALVDNQRALLKVTQLTVEGDVLREALNAARARFMLRAYQAVIASDQANLALAKKRLSTGTVTESEVLAAENQLAQDKANLPLYQEHLHKANDMLALLVGEQPGVWQPPTFTLFDFTLPRHVPLLLPATLVRNRPDVLAAEANLHAASAMIGVTTAAMLPNVTLSAYVAPSGTALADLFHRSNIAWDTMAELTAPLFHGGALFARRKVAIGLYHAACHSYQQTVLDALRQVSDLLHALKADANILAAKNASLVAARRTRALAHSAYAVGETDFTPFLNTTRTAALAHMDAANAYADRLQDTAYLYIALGGTGPFL